MFPLAKANVMFVDFQLFLLMSQEKTTLLKLINRCSLG